jgi:antitoxin component YwqK of YwqJK toxin-antitoxin module
LLIISFSLFILVSCSTNEEVKSDRIVGTNYDEKTKTGIVNTFHENGKVATIVKLVNGKKHGLSRSYYENGNLRASVKYKYGVKQGEAKSYYQKGGLYRETNYLEGEIDGVRKKYRPNGKLLAEIPYKYGWPGKGLKEYLVSGKEKTDYPSFKVEIIKQLSTGKPSYVKCYFEGSKNTGEYYMGELINDQFMHRRLIKLPTNDSHGILNLNTVSDEERGKTILIIGKINTKLKNPYIDSKSVIIPF